MSLRGKRDIPATEERGFISARSFVRLEDGGLILAGRDWHQQKLVVCARDGHKCRECGKPVMLGLWADVHHILSRGNRGNDNLDNLVLLCSQCHKRRHPEKQVRWRKKESNASQES